MSEEWEEVKLGDVCLKITDGSHNPPKGINVSEHFMLSSKNVFDDKINFDKPRYLSKKDFETENKRTNVTPNDVLLTIVGTIGRSAVVPEGLPKFTLQRSVAVLKPDKSLLDSRFLMLSLQSILEVLTDGARGVAQKGIYLKALRELSISLPSLPEQKRIVAILDEAFEGIDRAIANAEKNLANARELFESYLNKVFTEKGEGWATKQLKDFCTDFKSAIVDGPFGSNLKREHFTDQGVPVLKLQNIKSYKILLKNLDYVSPEKAVELKRHSYKKNDIVMTKLGNPLGVSAIVGDIDDGVIVADLVRIRADLIDTKYLCYQLNSPVVSSFINSKQKGATRPRVKISIVRELPIAAPSLPEQKLIVEILDSLQTKTQHLEAIYQHKLTALAELKQSLLQKAFSGELTVNDTAINEEAVA
jgi:type I restriction enzyme, S subunit